MAILNYEKLAKKLQAEAEILADEPKKNELIAQGYRIIEKQHKYYWCEEHTMQTSVINRNEYYQFSKTIRAKGLWYYIGNDGYTNYISSNKNHRYGPENIIYNVMFYLGSITRYHPYLFDDIFSDKEQWLMSEFLKTQPRQILYLATAKVLGQSVLKAYLYNDGIRLTVSPKYLWSTGLGQ